MENFPMIKKRDVLKNPNRKRIFEYIKQNPGKNFSQLSNELNIAKSTLSYHLIVLVEFGLIKRFRVAQYKKYYLSKKNDLSDFESLTDHQILVLNLIKESTKRQVDIVDITGISQSKTSRILSHLLKKKFVTRTINEKGIFYETGL